VTGQANDTELAAWWSLSLAELRLIASKPRRSCLAFAAQLKLYGRTGRFAEQVSEIPAPALSYLAEQVDAATSEFADHGFEQGLARSAWALSVF
jgi:hypothetical protein